MSRPERPGDVVPEPAARGAPGSAPRRAPGGGTLPCRLRPMQAADVGAVIAVEAAAYPFPWTRGNFIDSLAVGYPALLLEDAEGTLLGYFVALVGVEEVHLLNITVAPRFQGRGLARTLFDALVATCRAQRAAKLWLEVRASNERAQALYAHLGFRTISRRKGYYPAPFGRREDAVVMSLAIATEEAAAADALD